MRHPVLDLTPCLPGDLVPGGAPGRSRTEPVAGADSVRTLPGAVAFRETELRDFYDPAGRQRRRPAGALLADVASSRVPFSLPPVGRLSGHEVVLAEALHAGLDARPGVRSRPTDPHVDAVVLPIDARRQRAIAAAVDRYADTVASAVLEVADDPDREPRHLRSRPAGPRRHRDGGRLVRAGSVLAAVAHDGAVRRSGRPYWCHPDEVASILAAAWGRHAGAESDPRLEISRFLAYCHDAYEDALDPVAGYLSSLSVVVSPRVVLAVLRRLAVPDAVEVARVLLLLSRTRATDGSRLPYPAYLERGIAAGQAYFTLVKSADIHHNLTIEPDHIDPTDPRAPARYGKQAMYRAAAARLRDAAGGHDDRIARTVSAVPTVGTAELPASPHTGTGSLGRSAAAVREKVSASRAPAPEVRLGRVVRAWPVGPDRSRWRWRWTGPARPW